MFRILIVEDSALFRQALHGALQARFPFTAYEEAGDAREARRIADTYRPDLVFVDIRLPDENGLEFTRKLKSSRSSASVVVLTSYDLPEYIRAVSSCGADHYLIKGKSRYSDFVALVESMAQ